MLAKRVSRLPKEGERWLFEPKWDGFRMLIFREGDEIFLQSRDQKALDRYFPELRVPLLEALPGRCVLDGEVVIARSGRLDFEALLQRIHPAESRVEMLAEKTPASVVFWDLLAVADESLLERPFAARRARLETLLAALPPPLYLTPATEDRATAEDWFERFEGAGLDGVMAKAAESAYQPGKRTMLKIKHERTVDCVIGGFRWHKNGHGSAVGSLLLGLFDEAGRLQHVGVAASFTARRRQELVEELEPLRNGGETEHPWRDWIEATRGEQRVPGGRSRWSRGKDQSWVPLRPERVVEVAYDHMEGSRFRHTAHFRRWRPDKPPSECRYDQLDVSAPFELEQIFRS